MKTNFNHPVLGQVEGIQTAQLPELPTIAIEVIEFSVMIILLYVIFHAFRKSDLRKRMSRRHILKPSESSSKKKSFIFAK